MENWQEKLHEKRDKHQWSDEELGDIYGIIAEVQADLKTEIKEKVLKEIAKA